MNSTCELGRHAARALKPYPDYKDSGVPWLGEVPKHWEVRRLKSWLDVNEFVLSEDTDPEYTFEYLDIGSVATGRLTAKPERIRFGNSPSRARRVVRPGDTIVSTVRTYLKAVWHAEHQGDDLVASTGFAALLTPRRGTFPRFVSYFCQSDPFTNRVTAEAVGIAYPAIAETRLGTFEVCIPPYPEQAAIVRFLDYADRRIRRYIRAKQKLIALLEEQKQALIHQAVTGQIDVRTGQAYPAYKPSGVEWLGEVPAHWTTERLKSSMSNIVEQTTERHGTVLYVALEHVESWTGRLRHAGLDVSFDSQVKYFQSGDVLFGKLRPYLAKVTRPTSDGVCVGEFLVLRPRHSNATAPYMEQLLRSKLIIDAVNSSTFGAKMPRADWRFMGGMTVALPPLSEQADIVCYLDEITADIATVIDRAHCQINLLQEYRTRLIADVVTGKLDVREASASLPEVDPTADEEDLDDTLDIDPGAKDSELALSPEEVGA